MKYATEKPGGKMKYQVRETHPREDACAVSKELFTYGDYETWPDDQRWELIDGVPYDMTPAPSRRHQEILGALHLQFATYLKGKPCRVYLAPFDVRLPEGQEEDNRIKTVVQPDLTVVCDRTKLDNRGCKGAPDLCIEIISPHTAVKDAKIKLALYEKVGIKEFWLVYPLDATVIVFTLDSNGKYGKPNIFITGDQVPVGIFSEELSIDLGQVFEID
jgi:Uma2 family endonuclease